jgi:hypothetical protein
VRRRGVCSLDGGPTGPPENRAAPSETSTRYQQRVGPPPPAASAEVVRARLALCGDAYT